MKNNYFHITSYNNISSILEKGLIPSMGSRTKRMLYNGNLPRIYLCKSMEDVKKLSEIAFWKTHPDFLNHGQFLLSVKTDADFEIDPAFTGGIIIYKPISVQQIKLIGMI
jgi:hypothetical protein